MINIIESGLAVAILFLLLFWGGEKRAPIEDPMRLENTTSLRGAFALIIIYHHLSGYINSVTFLFPFRYCGYIVVAYFFFLSGYGVMWGFKNKENYMNHFLLKRLPKLYLPYIVSIIIYAVYYYLTSKTSPSFSQVLSSLIGINSISPLGWYVGALLFCYIIFYISMFFSEQKRMYIFLVLFLLMYILLFVLPIDETFTRSLIGFPMGMWFCIYKDKAETYIRDKYWIKLAFIVLLCAFGIMIKLGGEYYGYSLIKLAGNIVSCFFAVLLLICFIERFQIQNRFLCFVGGISFEVYLYHKLFLDLFYRVDIIAANCLLFAAIVLISTLVFSFALHKLDSKALKIITNDKRRKNE